MRRLVLFLLLFPFLVFAQESIDVQRPTLTESNTVIQKNFIQFENGFVYAINDEYDFGSFVRFGATEKLEFRLYKSYRNPSFQLGGKVMLYKGKDLLPGVALTMSYDPIFHGQDYRLSLTGSKGNFFYTLNGANNGNWYGIALLGVSLAGFNVFGEYQIDDQIQHQVNGGITYIVKKEVQLDIHGGTAFSDAGNYPYIGAGVSFRVK